MLPPEIVEIVGKTFGFGISVENEDNFNAMKVWNLKDIMWKRIETLHQMSTASRKNQCTNVMKNDKLDREEYSDQKSG